MSTSWIDELRRYRRSRVPAATCVPLVVFLCAAAGTAGRPADAVGLAWTAVLACSLIIQFRLWDDLSDRERDRRQHPKRVLPQARSLNPFRALLAAAFGSNFLLIAARPASAQKVAVFLLLNTGLLGWYAWRRRCGAAPTLAGAHMVLAKYPVFVYLLSAGSPGALAGRLGLAMGTVYLSFCVYEMLHDSTLRAAPGADGVLALEMTLLGAMPFLEAALLEALDTPPSLLQGAVMVAGALVMLVAWWRRRAPVGSGPWRFGVFVVGLGQLLTFSLRGAS